MGHHPSSRLLRARRTTQPEIIETVIHGKFITKVGKIGKRKEVPGCVRDPVSMYQ
jgi:hypothetical protein